MFINQPYSPIGTAKFSLITVMDSESTEPGTADRVLDIVKLAKMVSKLVKIHHHYRETTKKSRQWDHYRHNYGWTKHNHI